MSASAKITMPPEVKEVLAACTATANHLHLPAKQLDPKLYQKVKKHIEAHGGKWKGGKVQAHVFPEGSNPLELIGLAVEQGHSTNHKTLLQAFYSPAAVAHAVAEIAEIEPHHRLLEPSAGEGAIIAALVSLGANPHLITAVEINEAALAKIDHPGPKLCRDFLTVERFAHQFDRIVMNPPFQKDQDIKHVLHAFKFLRPGGRLVSIMGANTNRTSFHALIRTLWQADAETNVENMPPDSFKESGTKVPTITLTIQR